MPHTGRPQIDEDEFQAISISQNHICAGINCGNQIDEYSVIQHLRPRTKGGSDDPENLEILCPDCSGYHSHRLGIPFHLWKQSQHLLDSQPEIHSFNHLVRLALHAFIEGQVENVIIDQRQLDDLNSQLQQMDASLRKMKKLQSNMRPHFQELAKYLEFDAHDRKNLTKRKIIPERNILLYPVSRLSRRLHTEPKQRRVHHGRDR